MKNIILTGFMGAGKSTVGRIVSGILRMPFIDTDNLIKERAGREIVEIFAQDGEAAFRKLEAEVCQEIVEGIGQVIAVGGGTLLNAETRALFESSGMIICLSAELAEIVRRVGDSGGRPLFGDLQGVEALFEQRHPHYARLPYQIDTTGKSAGTVAKEVANLYEQTERITIPVRGESATYPVYIGEGLLIRSLPKFIFDHGFKDVAIVTNDTVAPLYGEALRAHIPGSYLITLSDGEEYKTLESITSIYDALLEHRASRSTVIVALGGGVIGDMAGFAAASFMRGIAFIQAPTSLLAMVDASVGGKTGVNLPQGKNLVGAFKDPLAVFADTTTLATLPDEHISNGMAEAIKAGLLADPTLLDAQADDLLTSIIGRAVKVKAVIVTKDRLEQGVRAYLNLGHTFAHAIEKVSHFEIKHGAAVGIGMVAAIRLSARIGLCDPGLIDQTEAILARWNLPTTHSYAPDIIWDAMQHDKKWTGSQARFVLLEEIGKPCIRDDVQKADVIAVLEETRRNA